MMEAGLPIPRALERNFPLELVATPIEDIDPYYRDQQVRRCHSLLRLSHVVLPSGGHLFAL